MRRFLTSLRWLTENNMYFFRKITITAAIFAAVMLCFKTESVMGYELKEEVVNVSPELAIYVNKALNCVTVYAVLPDGEEIPVKSMAASCGRAGHTTPSGTFKVSEKYDWRLMVDKTWGQYATRFNGHILFHSVPYYRSNPASLESDQYNLLGVNASLGCVRLCAADAKWIYDNAPRGTRVVVYEDKDNPGPLGKPTPIRIDENDEKSCWDPTDPDPKNPWKQ